MVKNANDYSKVYTHPKLREILKEEIKASDRGGNPGEWSARKSQLLAQEYKKQGGDYIYRGSKSRSQRSLERWQREEWQTKDGETTARQDGETKRYLPKKAWEQLSDQEKRATDKKKRQASKKGQQHVSNTKSAKQARRST